MNTLAVNTEAARAKKPGLKINEIIMGGHSLCSVTADQNNILIITIQTQNINN